MNRRHSPDDRTSNSMFGYIRPVKSELKVREYEQYRSCYCALCHALGENYGAAARFILNYDFVFLAMLLWEPEMPLEYCSRKCPVCPFKKQKCCRYGESLATCAGYSVILGWWQLCDSVDDEHFFKGLKYRTAKLMLRRAYRKAAARYPDFDEKTKSGLAALRSLENGAEASLDTAADCFAGILESASCGALDESVRRALSQLLYHIGRWIYIIDACDDLDEDLKAKRFNPVAVRFGLSEPTLSDEVKKYISTTLFHSRNLAGTAFELLPETPWADIVRNVICLGMPAVGSAVLDGTWKSIRKNDKKKTGAGTI